MKRTLSAVLFLFLIVNAVQGVDWPQYRADAGRSGYTPEKLPAELSLKWIHKSPHVPAPAWRGKDTRMPFDYAYQPVIADGMLYYGSSADCKVYALDAASGKERWAYFTQAPVRFAPAVWNDRVFVVSDDGYLYCLSAKNGKLLWKKRGGPENAMILGNDRMISRWPARGGVAIEGDTVYFGAGIWPTDGIYIYAVDAATGNELWVNDDSGGMLYKQPHPGAVSKSGVSSHGYLVVAGDKLLVPTGRAVPAAFDRETGAFEYFHLQEHRTFGGSRVMAFDGLLFVDNNYDRQTTLSAGIIKGIFSSSDGEQITGDMIPSIAVASWPGHILYAAEDAVKALDISNLTRDTEIKGRNGTTVIQKKLNEPSWSIDTPADPGGSALIVAGNTIISATSNNKVAVMDAESKEVVWSSRVDGVPCGLAVADGRLYVSTDTGTLYCYDDAFVENPKLIETVPENFPYGKNTKYADAAREIIRNCGVADGYCLDLGCGDGALACELAKRTNLYIVAVDSDPENVTLARKKLDSAGLYGVRVTVFEGDPENTSFPDYFANLIVSGKSVSEGAGFVSTEEIARIQRPYGGIACIGTPGSMKKTERGGLDGAGEWTHQYHDPANTITSEDELVKGRLGMLWFRDDDYDTPSRHGRGVAPLYSKGRLFYEGTQALRAIDAYNGRTIWEIPLMDVQKAYDADHLVGVAITQSNICLEGDRLYVRTAGVPTDGDYSGRSCLVIDVRNGSKIAEYRTPPGPEGDENRYWGYIAVEDGILFGSIADPGHVVNYAYRESDMNKMFSESIYFFAMDAATGQLMWTYTPEYSIRHNAIAIGNGRVFLIDRPQAETDRIRNPHKRENPQIEQPKGKLVALDAKNGSILWENEDDIYGTLLALSTQHDALVMTYQYTRFRQFSELGGHMAVFTASDGSVMWNHSTVVDSTREYSYSSRPVINGRMVFLEPYAWDLVTGEKLDFEFSRTYACGILAGSKNMMLYRSGTVGYYDLTTQEETENFGGIRPGCWINAIPAGGLVLMPDATDRCNCSYLNKATVALKSY